MIKECDFKNNITNILSDSCIENITIKQLEILKELSMDSNLIHLFFLDFESNYPYEDGLDLQYLKTQDFLYRLDNIVNDWIILKHKIMKLSDIKKVLINLISENYDFYSAVNYDNSDEKMFEEYGDPLLTNYNKL